MPRRRGQQIVGPHNLLHPLGGIVDHDHEVVGRCAVASPQDEIIDCLGMAPVTSIHDRDVGMLRSKPQRGRPATRLVFGDLGGAEVTAGAGVVARWEMRCAGRLTNLAARTPTAVREPSRLEISKR